MQKDIKSTNDCAGFSVEVFSKSLYENDWPSHPHSHSYPEFIFCESGCGKIFIENDVITISKNDLIIISGHVIHKEESSDEFPLTLYYAGFKNLELNLKQNYKKIPLTAFLISPADIFLSLSVELSNSAINREIAVQALFNLLITFSARGLKTIPQEKEIKPSKLHKVTTYIDENYNQNISLKKLSKMIPLSVPQLTRLFKQEFNLTPLQYILFKRIQASKILLKTSSYSIESISEIIGFSSTSNFIAKFKLSESISPAKFRKQSAEKI